jgi:hypothetical protein
MLLARFKGFSSHKGVNTYHAGDDSSFGPHISERFFIAHSVLDNHNRSVFFLHRWTERSHRRCLVDSFVRADNIVERLVRFGWALDHFVRDDGVFPVVGRVDNQALSGN